MNYIPVSYNRGSRPLTLKIKYEFGGIKNVSIGHLYLNYLTNQDEELKRMVLVKVVELFFARELSHYLTYNDDSELQKFLNTAPKV